MIPLCLVTGFFGSGKTTLLRHIIDERDGQRIAYLVNEFAARDVDAEVLAAEVGAGAVSLAGGSVFCRCLLDRFVDQLAALAAQQPAPQAVVVEASGIADPKPIETLLQRDELAGLYTLTSIVTVVEPGSFLKFSHVLPNIIAQVEAADVGVINKVDLYDAGRIEQI